MRVHGHTHQHYASARGSHEVLGELAERWRRGDVHGAHVGRLAKSGKASSESAADSVREDVGVTVEMCNDSLCRDVEVAVAAEHEVMSKLEHRAFRRVPGGNVGRGEAIGLQQDAVSVAEVVMEDEGPANRGKHLEHSDMQPLQLGEGDRQIPEELRTEAPPHAGRVTVGRRIGGDDVSDTTEPMHIAVRRRTKS